MINARGVQEPDDERLPEEDEEANIENDDLDSQEDDEEELDEEEGATSARLRKLCRTALVRLHRTRPVQEIWRHSLSGQTPLRIAF